MFKSSLCLIYVDHLLNFLITSHSDLSVLVGDNLFMDKNSVFVIGGNRLLGYFNLSLLEIHNHLEVVLHLFKSFFELVRPLFGSILILLNRLHLMFKVT